MNVGAHQSGGMRTGKRPDLDGIQVEFGNIAVCGLAEIDLAGCQFGDDGESTLQVFRVRSYDRRGIGGQRICIHRVHEDRVRDVVRAWNLAVGSASQCGPQTRDQQVFYHLLAGQLGKLTRLV